MLCQLSYTGHEGPVTGLEPAATRLQGEGTRICASDRIGKSVPRTACHGLMIPCAKVLAAHEVTRDLHIGTLRLSTENRGDEGNGEWIRTTDLQPCGLALYR